MGINNYRNMVILKNLPSNLIEEAFVVLKQNQKVKKLEYIENKFEEELFSNENSRKNEDEYIIKEAELLISNYITKLENEDFKGNKEKGSIEKKYKNLKKVVFTLIGVIIIGFIFIISK